MAKTKPKTHVRSRRRSAAPKKTQRRAHGREVMIIVIPIAMPAPNDRKDSRPKTRKIDDHAERFVRDWAAGRIQGIPAVPVKSQDLYAFYRDWCGRSGYPRYAPEPKFLAEITKRSGIRKATARYMNGSGIKQARFCFPPGAEQPVDVQQAAWLSACLDDFRDAVKLWREETVRM